MRGEDQRSEGFFSYVRLETRILPIIRCELYANLLTRPWRSCRGPLITLCARGPAVDPAGAAAAGPSVAGVLHGALGAQLMEQLDYNLLFRWFVGLSADDPVWDATVFWKNRDRLLDGDIAAKFMASVLNPPRARSFFPASTSRSTAR